MKSATDAQIQEFCEQKGDVFRLRCPKDASSPGQNRGYCMSFCDVGGVKLDFRYAFVKIGRAHV